MEEDEKTLTELNILVRGNGTPETGLIHRTGELEKKFYKISTKLTVVVVLLMVLIAVQAPGGQADVPGAMIKR